MEKDTLLTLKMNIYFKTLYKYIHIDLALDIKSRVQAFQWMPWLHFNVCLITFHNVVRQVLKWPTYGLKLIGRISATTSIDFRIFDGILWTRRPFKHLKKKNTTKKLHCPCSSNLVEWKTITLHFILLLLLLFCCCCFCCCCFC